MKFLYSELRSSNSFKGNEPTLLEVLDSREKKQYLQQECLKKHSCSLLSLSLVCPGGVKKNLLLEYVFHRALETIESFFINEKITIKSHLIQNEETGFYALFSLDVDAILLKKKMVEIEENFPIARLWDLDVLNKEGNIISRIQINNNSPRRCLVCNENAKICAKKRTHRLEEIYEKMQKIVSEDCFAQNIAQIAKEALIKEVVLSPKPGLVDMYNTGAHKDMNKQTFMESARALQPFFAEFVLKGIEQATKEPQEVFRIIRTIGIEAEKAMYSATLGINTHKGIIFSLGLVTTAIGYLFKRKKEINPQTISKFVSEATSGIIKELENSNYQKETAGIRLYNKYKLTGARGEASSGFPTVLQTSLPIFYKYKNLGERHQLLLTLVKLISVNNDTNIVNRGGIEALDWIKKYATDLLYDSNIYKQELYLIEKLNTFDSLCIEKNISPGGSADLLALTWFFFELKNRIF